MVVNASINRNSFQRNSLTLCLNVLGEGEQAKANVSRRKELVNIRIRKTIKKSKKPRARLLRHMTNPQ